MIADNLKSVRQRIARCCEKIGRPADSVCLVCVTKEASIDEIGQVLDLGVRELGENRVQDAIFKYRAISGNARWHLVGHLQTNKAKDALKIFSLVHSVDSIRLAKEMDRLALAAGKVQEALLQVNVTGEKTKFGVAPDEVFEVLGEISRYENLKIKGFMTIAPEVDDPELARPHFRQLRQLFEKIKTKGMKNVSMEKLSMGMSGDFEVAIEEGSNIVRIGRAIFGRPRPSTNG